MKKKGEEIFLFFSFFFFLKMVKENMLRPLRMGKGNVCLFLCICTKDGMFL